MNKPSILAILLFLAIGTLCLSPFFGQDGWTSPGSVVSGGDPVSAEIFWRIRVPRALTAFLAGLALALSGMAFQALFRNPLATPFTLGVSSGASFGAAVYVLFGASFAILGISGATLASFLGAGLSMLLVYGLTLTRKGFSTYTMLLAGVAVSFLLLQPDSLSSVSEQLHPDVPHFALAHGRLRDCWVSPRLFHSSFCARGVDRYSDSDPRVEPAGHGGRYCRQPGSEREANAPLAVLRYVINGGRGGLGLRPDRFRGDDGPAYLPAPDRFRSSLAGTRYAAFRRLVSDALRYSGANPDRPGGNPHRRDHLPPGRSLLCLAASARIAGRSPVLAYCPFS